MRSSTITWSRWDGSSTAAISCNGNNSAKNGRDHHTGRRTAGRGINSRKHHLARHSERYRRGASGLRGARCSTTVQGPSSMRGTRCTTARGSSKIATVAPAHNRISEQRGKERAAEGGAPSRAGECAPCRVSCSPCASDAGSRTWPTKRRASLAVRKADKNIGHLGFGSTMPA